MKLPVKVAAGAGLYFLPTVVAVGRRHRNWGALFMLNLLAGWTIVGWVICLVWAVVRDPSSY